MKNEHFLSTWHATFLKSNINTSIISLLFGFINKIIDFGVLLLKQFSNIVNPSMPDFNKIYNRMNSLTPIASHS